MTVPVTLPVPTWARVHYAPIDFNAISYYSAPRQNSDGPKSLAEVDPKLLATVLTHHVVPGALKLADLKPGTFVGSGALPGPWSSTATHTHPPSLPAASRTELPEGA